MKKNNKYGINYVMREDGCWYPDLSLEQETHYDIGKYGLMAGEYVMEHNRHLYITKVNDGTWNQYLHDAEVACQQLEDEMLVDTMKVAGITEELKCRDSMEWVSRMSVVRMEVEREVLCRIGSFDVDF